MSAVLMAIVAIAVIILLLGMVVGGLLKERPTKRESFISQQVRRIEKEGKQ